MVRVVALLILVAGCSSEPVTAVRSAPKATEKPPVIIAEALLAEIAANEIAAEVKYGGRIIIVAGHVLKVARSIDGRVSVILRKNASDSFEHVECLFPDSYAGVVAKFRAGDAVAVAGVFRSVTMGCAELDPCTEIDYLPHD